MSSGETAAGKQACDKGISLLADDTATLSYFAWPLVASKDTKPEVAALAVKVAEQATKAAPQSSSLWNTLGMAQYRAGQLEKSIAFLSKAEELSAGQNFAFNGFFLAMAHWQLDHKDEARKLYDESVEWMEKNQPKHEESSLPR